MIMRGSGIESLKQAAVNRLIVDYSQLSKFEACPRRYNYVYNQGLTDTIGIAALYSKLIVHPMLSQWYEAKGKAVTQQELADLFKKFYNASANQYNSERERRLYSQEVAINILDKYVQLYQMDHTVYSFVSSEEVYWVVLEELPDVVLVSKPDTILCQNSDGSLVTQDYKLTSRNINRDLLPYDRQFLGQAFTVASKFMAKVSIFTDVNYTSGKVSVHISRDLYKVDEEILDHWRKELIMSVKSMLLLKQSNIWIKRSPFACFEFLKPCPFIPLCSVGAVSKLAMESMNKANPLEYLGM